MLLQVQQSEVAIKIYDLFVSDGGNDNFLQVGPHFLL